MEDEILFKALFGELIFADGIFGTSEILLLPTWVKRCPLPADWQPISYTALPMTTCEVLKSGT